MGLTTEDLLAQGRRGDPRGEVRFMALSLLAGVGAGFVGSAFHWLIDRLMSWPQRLAHVVEGWWLVGLAALVTMTCTVLAVFVVRRFAPEASGSGVQEIEGAMQGLFPVRWRRVLPVKFFAGIMAISSGLVLGREGPTIHIGASIGAAVSDFFRTSELERRGLLAGGAASGLACAFNAPLAAVLFIIEETHREFAFTFRTYLGVIVAVIGATVVTQSVGGSTPDLLIPSPDAPLGLLPFFLLLGGAMGMLGVLLNRSILWALAFSEICHRHVPYLYPAVVGLVVGALLILIPQSVTGGETVIVDLVNTNLGVVALLALAAVRFLTTVGSYSSGVPGGIFAPILTLAVCVGLAFGGVVESLVPDADGEPVIFAIAAMGGLFTASVRAPIVGVALTMELTGSYALCLPLMVTCLTADLVAQWSGGRPIYAQLLERSMTRSAARSSPASDGPTGLA